MSEFNWTCLHCQRVQTVSGAKSDHSKMQLDVGETIFGKIGLVAFTVGCSNPACKEFSITVELHSGRYGDYRSFIPGNTISSHRLRPDSLAKILPDFVPRPVVEDYTEACKIRDLSPKASATLSRRCLQGMIRDFCGISKSRLIDEIKELQIQVEAGEAASGVTRESLEAIDSVRQIGNIGAHMEKDINVIIEVDPDEAQALIELIEMLIDEWYIARNTRQLRLAKVKTIADEKKQAKNGQS